MSIIVAPLINLAGNLLYFAGKGVWWVTKRAIWGKQLTAEELQQQQFGQFGQILRTLQEQNSAAQNAAEDLMTAMEEQSRVIHEQQQLILTLHNKLELQTTEADLFRATT